MSYVTYTGVGATSGAINANAPEPLAKVKSQMGESIVTTQQPPTWLAETFPEAVADGTITVINGSVYIEGFALTEIVSLCIAVLSFVVLVLKMLADLKLFIEERESKRLEKEILRIQKERLEKEDAGNVCEHTDENKPPSNQKYE